MADQIEEVKQKTDVVAIIGERIELKKAGRNFKALCPFHGEKTPSFMVSPELQMYKCFGCDHKGDVFNFLEEYEGMEFGEALKYLAERAGVRLKPTTYKAKSDKERIYEINNYTVMLYSKILSASIGKIAKDYLTKERGLTLDTIKTFQLGYSPNTAFIGYKFLVGKKKIPIDELAKAGLVYKGDRGVFDRFRGRVIFPLHDHRGNVIGFAGRILPQDKNKDLAKYINTPETPAYHKGSVLYGLNLSRPEIKRSGVAIVVEGELDLISCWQAGIKNVIALKGTAMTEEQVKLISRYCSKITLALDADLAGDAAARRGITIASNLGLDVGVLELKDFKDPDDAVRKDPEGFKKMLAKPIGVWDFIIDVVLSKHDVSTGSGKSGISKEIAPILVSIEDNILRAHYTQVVSDRLDVPLEAVANELVRVTERVKVPKDTEGQDSKTADKNRQQLLEERVLAIGLQSNPELLVSAEIENLIKSSLTKRILENYKLYKIKFTKFNAQKFAKLLPPELLVGYSELMMQEFGEVVDDPDRVQREIAAVIKELKLLDIKSNLTKLAKSIKILEDQQDLEKLESAKQQFAKFSEILSKLEESNKGAII